MEPARARIFRSDDIARVDRGGDVYSLPMVSGDVGAQNLMTGMTVFPPSGGIALHTHNTEESVVILEGEAICEIEDARHHLRTFDAAYIPSSGVERSDAIEPRLMMAPPVLRMCCTATRQP